MIPTFHTMGFGFEGAPPPDPYLSQVTLLMRMEGANGGTSFSDSGPLGSTITLTGGYTTSTDFAKAGNTSCKSAGSGGHLRVTNTANHELTGAFTVEAWTYWDVAPTTIAAPVGMYRGSVGSYAGPVLWTDRKWYFEDPTDKINGTTAISLDAWHHIAITRTGTTIRMWVDGVQEGSTWTSSTTYCGNGDFTYIGSIASTLGVMGYPSTPAYVDLVRITKADRYGTTAFTPPTDY